MTPVRNLVAICATWGFLVFARAEASETLSHDIGAQPLSQALSAFAAQTGLQLIYVSGIASDQVSEHVPRGLSAADALQRLLAGSGLRFEYLNDRTVRIFTGTSCAVPTGCPGPPAGAMAIAADGPPGRPSSDGLLEEVIVAGSRWWLDPTEAVAPVIVLNRRDIERGGASSIGDVLQALPMTTGSPLNTNGNAPGSAEPRGRGAAGDGSVRISLHDLPTVVLLNGRRLPSSGLGADASVDLNTLPMSFIDRVEVLASGASAAFGADAIGGVVNIVTRQSKPGLELTGTRTIAERGDGEIVTGQAAIGFDLLGGAWSLGLDYVEQDGVTMDRRSYSARPLIIVDGNGTVVPDGLNNMTPEGVFNVPEGNILGLEPGLYTRVSGSTGRTAADYRPFDRVIDGFNPAPYNYSQTPNERATLWLTGSRPLGESANLALEAFAHHRDSAQQAAPPFYRTGLGRPTEVGHPADNYYNPFAVDVPVVNRRLVEAGNRVTEQKVELWRALIGLQGNVNRWTWELALQGARADATAVESGFFSRPHLIHALGASGLDNSGRIVCGSHDPETGRVPEASIIPDCVPFDLFGGVGSITEQQLGYVMPGAMINRGTNEQRFAELVLSGPGGRMLGRDVQWQLGANYRREAGSVAPDSLHSNYVGDQFRPSPDLFRATPEVSGAYDAYELLTAAQVPLLHDRPWARDMVLNGVLRWSDYRSFGSRTTWQAGLRWQLFEELALRANYADVFRAPSLVELYERPTYAEQFVWDPCGNFPVPEQVPNCAANGVPDGSYVQGATGLSGNPALDGLGTVVVYGGNPELEPQAGRTLGAGLVYTPMWAEGLSASVDYFQTTHTTRERVSPEVVLIVCADFGFCSGITRNEEGRVMQLETRYRNFGEFEVRAFDFAIDWSTTNRIGELNTTLFATYLDRWDRKLPGGEVFSYAGTFDTGARPRWRGLGHLDWRSGAWMASYAAEYIGGYSELVDPWPQFGVFFDPFYRRVDPVLYHDVEVGFGFDSGVTVRAAITNVTDEDPPYLNIAPANTDVTTYRLLGRSYFLELRYQLQ
jgi:outer membrane receptor protein involved in Fe transport